MRVYIMIIVVIGDVFDEMIEDTQVINRRACVTSNANACKTIIAK